MLGNQNKSKLLDKEFEWQYAFPADIFIKELLGHSSVKTTMIYTHVLNKGIGVKSPLD